MNGPSDLDAVAKGEANFSQTRKRGCKPSADADASGSNEKARLALRNIVV